MQLIFLDESGSPYSSYKAYRHGYEEKYLHAKEVGGRYPQYPYFIVAAVCLPESKYSVVDDWFQQMKTRFFGISSNSTGAEYEIKGSILYPLRQNKEPRGWAKNPTKQAAAWRSLSEAALENLESSIFELLQRIEPVVWAIVVKQADIFPKYRERTWPPYYWCLTFLQQRVAQFVQAQYGSYERGLFLMDEHSTLSSATHFENFLEIRDTINQTASWPVDFRKSLIDVPMTAKSHLFQPLQLADIVAHAILRHVRRRDALDWFSRIEPFLAKHWRTGRYEEAGFTVIR